ncbi:MAG: UDP-glucose 4-epimerase, UDP-glucose 4-epimerase [Candidatus Gottesmanbacteria bacterium GW2011_GWA2_43_14]|uniref:UDP-glucose 4-epimerase, UDP-glucose 4-epimerase n=1 Tax=Candidatus Gottesmanbacteria bacterium GW2011_GWA2_43_14 TaxID=1618443 RepID=A0A0G1FUH9_9BACT|nr:MAG: UDP-glucose 4-epimerase, UDP-glucose 4-epimerase [Candidatus Gottesmanbacteria bacterium GW2011_GWA2_43_14]
MNILITGGAGFIASQITDAYIDAGHRVAVIDDLSSGKREFISPKAVFYRADIRDINAVVKIFTREKPEILNHHAAQISVRNSVDDPRHDAEVNLIGLINLMEAGKTFLKKTIFASSGGVVYGDADKIPTSEDYVPLLPLSPYGVSKLAGEHYLHYYRNNFGIPFIALRYSNVYGPRQNPHGEAGVVAIFSRKLLKGEVPVINGDGLQIRDYIYVGDVVRANLKAMEKKVSGSFNIGTGLGTNVIDLYDKIRRITGSTIQAKHGPAKKGEQKKSVLSNSQAAKILDWQPKTDLDKGLKATVDYFKENE